MAVDFALAFIEMNISIELALFFFFLLIFNDFSISTFIALNWITHLTFDSVS